MKIKVGLIVIFKEDENIWKNGLIQNCIYLYDLLSEIDIVEKVSFLQAIPEERDASQFTNRGYDVGYFNTDNILEITKNYNLLISIGATFDPGLIKVFKKKEGNKTVMYKGGNEFINEIESILYGQYRVLSNQKLIRPKYIPPIIDEIWMVPQQEFHNKDFFEIKHKTRSRVVPFIWSSKFIDESIATLKKEGHSTLFHEKEFSKWTFSSFEPNMSVLKNSIPLIYALEYAYIHYKEVKNKLDVFLVSNSINFHKNEDFINLVSTLELFQDKKLSFDGRYPIPYFLSKYTHAVISHQWGNALNYAYLDIVYLGYPLIHNAHICKDIGYYYEDWKLKSLSKGILQVITQHPKGKDTYMLNQRKIIERYTLKNKVMVEQYKKLILNLWNKNEIDNKEYDSKTNTLI